LILASDDRRTVEELETELSLLLTKYEHLVLEKKIVQHKADTMGNVLILVSIR